MRNWWALFEAFLCRWHFLRDLTCDITHISSLEENRKYPIERADRVRTQFGEAILLSIRDVAADRLCKVFLSQRYTAVFKDDDVLSINDGFAVWHLGSKGRCPDSNAYQLAIEQTHCFGFQMDLPAARLNVQIPEFLLSDMWTLPEKLKNVSLCMFEANPFWGLPFQN